MPALLAFVWSLGILAAAGAARHQTPASYAGEAACLSCHDTHAYQGSAHARSENPRTPAATHGCESCHGPGKAHADGGDPSAIRNPASMPVQDGDAVCTACHDRAAHAAAGRDGSCAGCHSVHHAAGAKLLKKR